MKKKEEEVRDGANEWDLICGSPLYDAYELVSLANIIERHMMALPSAINTGFDPSSSHEDAIRETKTTKKKKKKKTKKVIIVHERRKKKKSSRGVKSRICNCFGK